MKSIESKVVNKRIKKFVDFGLLPLNMSDLSPVQQEIYQCVLSETDMDKVVYRYLNYANENTKRAFIYKKIHVKESNIRILNKGMNFNIGPEDIILNDCCPFFKTKINYNSSKGMGNKLSDPTLYSIDRIDNSKGYVKGNVWIVSRLANQMKNNSTVEELKTFCRNAILIHSQKKP